MILEVKNLKLKIDDELKIENFNFSMEKGEVVGLVGESGSGKSLFCRSVLGLNSEAVKSRGEILYGGKNLLKLTDKEFSRLRGSKISIIFQEALSALNPLQKIGQQMAEVFKIHTTLKKKEIMSKIISLLKDVEINEAEKVINMYPHEVSGGMAQRILIALAISQNPDIILADEPTTALDSETENNILRLLKDIITEKNLSLLIVSHDLKVIEKLATRVVVIKDGKILEDELAEKFFENPKHEYSKYLLECSNLNFSNRIGGK